MSGLRVTNLRGETAGTSPKFPDGVVVTGVTTSTSFSGGLTGNVTGNVTGNISGTTGAFTGAVSGATGSFTGNVSIGGTLTYEDVTNVDSVGVITARAGIRVGGGQSIGSDGALTYYGDGSQLTGIQGGTADFEGFGTGITAGKPVIIRSDGKIGSVTGSGPAAPTLGTAVQFESGGAIRFASVYHAAENRNIIIYADNGDSNKGKAVAAAIDNSDNSVTFGSPSTFEDGSTKYPSAAYDPDTERIIINFVDQSNNNASWCVGSVSGSSISWGTPSVYYSSTVGGQMAVAYDTTNDRIVLFWPNGNSDLRVVTGTVNGSSTNTLSLGSTQEVDSGDTDHAAAIWHSTDSRTIVFYQQGDDGNKGYYAVCAYNSGGSGNEQTVGTPAAFTGGAVGTIKAVYDSNANRVVVIYQDVANNNYGTAIVGTLSSNTISWGTAVVFQSSDNTDHMDITFDTTNHNVLISYVDSTNSNYASVISGTVNGSDNSITFTSKIDLNSSASSGTTVSFNTTAQRALAGFNDGSVSGDGKGTVLQTSTGSTNVTTENFIGLAAAGISSGSSGSVTIPGGIDSNQSGLTTGRTYYVQNDGTLGLSADSPSVVAGTSISATQILVR
jgi:hypothetical protein|tara:strand:+ start:190 stop:2025 length:1836 start_codon:yes stop_codon:yes gene_type:complete